MTEIWTNWRSVASAALGLACGHMLNMYTASLFAPHLLQEFGWSRAQFALTGLTILAGVITLPIAGRLVDAIGVRRMATIGIVASPLLYLGFSLQTGSFAHYFLLVLGQAILVGATTTSVVYSRLIAERFVTSRGLALSLAACAPALTTIAVAPLLTNLIEHYGWRGGYVALAVAVAIAGACTLLLIPTEPGSVSRPISGPGLRRQYAAIIRNRTFRVIVLASGLTHATVAVQATQLTLLLGERGLDEAAAGWLISLYAFGIVVGRLVCGIALDRFAAHAVSAVALGLPTISFAIFVSGVEIPAILAGGVMILGLSVGADFDIIAFLVMRFFPLEVFGTVYSLIGSVMASSAALGALLLSITFQLGGGFSQFFAIVAVMTITGSLLFLQLGRHKTIAQASREDPAQLLQAHG